MNNNNNYRENKSRTNSASRLLLLLASTAAISTFAYSGISLAAVNPTNLVDSSYWYAG